MKRFIAMIVALMLCTISVSAAEVNCTFEDAEASFGTVTGTLAEGGSISFTEGFVGDGVALNGTYGLKMGSVSGDFTVSAMVNITSGGGTETVFFKNMGTASAETWTSIILDNGTPAVWANGGNFRWSRLITASDNVLAQWAYITYTEKDGTGSLYVNGALAGSSAVTASEGSLYMGATYWSADAPEGVVDEIYFNDSEALDADAIMEMYTNLAIQNVSIPERTISDLNLPDKIGNAQVSWVSSNESVITSGGKVVRGDENTTVTLSLYMGEELLATYTVTVLKNSVHTNDSVLLSYIFDESTRDVVEDVSGNGNHGIVYGSMAGTHFDGSDDYVELPANLLADSDEFTIVMRLKAEIAQTHQFTFCFGNGTSEYFFLNTSRPTTNTLRLALTQNGSGAEYDVASLPGIRDGEYAALAIAVKGSEATMYQNGIPVAFGDLGVSPSLLGNTTDNWLAKSPYNDPYFKGDIYEFTIYPRALEMGEIEAMHYEAPEEKSYIEAVEADAAELRVSLNRFGMVSAVFFDNEGKTVYAATAKASDDNLTAVFMLPEADFAGVELAAYDADRGIIRDRVAVAVYNGVAAYSTDGENLKITNTTGSDLNVTVMTAVFDGDILKEVQTAAVRVDALSYTVIENPAKDGGRLMVWYTLASLKPLAGQE